jgi:predicted enzyme related to lactoylglutathione lyase
MIKGFAGSSVWSENLNNLLPFYRDTLGLKPTMESPEFVVFGDVNGPTLGLGTHSEVRGKNSDPARHMVGVMTDDVRAEYERLRTAGIEFVDPPTDFGDGVTIATCKDPEGNYVQIMQFSGSTG